ncbi:TIGR04282 family arsenosugar biosynthesis glycosyltransferase [Mongoliitalea lutea]|uniref:Glycosyltransferase n=1 Tax=Mongoliitalea lutea TaxID=849756 RepID=A0A8J3CZL4_9BACT|nr:TIGR04282 family arsenosugar biosynthesis glycosyltransferase [Mongoliitalea lutea]GHB49490.1 hypothetical protein GCM10008106_32760 [Mongoliitalea lutea]
MKTQAIIVFQKEFKLGHVKTRVAATAGNHAALEIYKKLVSHTYQILGEVSAEADIYIYLDTVPTEKPEFIPEHFHLRNQVGNDLGEKITHAFSEIFSLGYQSIITVGTDCLDLQKDHLVAAFKDLTAVACCIGPANDGGYYLIGLSKPLPDIFINIPWSTEKVLLETIERLNKKDASYSLLEPLQDIDTELDWIKATNFIKI